MKKEISEKLEVLKDIAKEVNSEKNAKIEGIENDALVVVSDIEGRAEDFLVKLKHTGVIDSVEVDEATGKLKINLNKNFCGTIDFCGDLTAYKVVRPFGNEIVIEVFEELLAQIRKHNKKNKEEKNKQIQFVAVPGNHEFYNFWGVYDKKALLDQKDGDKDPLLIKLRSLKVIAEIQKYFLEQVKQNGDDITDNDYQGTDVNINERIDLLDKEYKMLDIIYNALSDKGAGLSNYFGYFLNYEGKKTELEQAKDFLKEGNFMIKTKGGQIDNNDERVNNKFSGKKNFTKEELGRIFTDDVCYLSFKNILEILKLNGAPQENSGEYTEWTENLINKKLSDLGKVLEKENFKLDGINEWPLHKEGLETQRASIKKSETTLKSFEDAIKKIKENSLQEGCIQEKIEDKNLMSLLRPLFWKNSALLSKIIFNHHGKKFRTLHHFGLFVPEDKSEENLTLDKQNKIFAEAFSKPNYFNIKALDDLRHLNRNIFEKNKIPTLFGHEGDWIPQTQTTNMYCVDTDHSDNLNVVCVVNSKNEIIPYYTYKCIKLKNEEQEKQNQQNLKNEEQKKQQNKQNFVKLKLGAYDEKGFRKLVIYECKPQENKPVQQPVQQTIANDPNNPQPAQQKDKMDNSNNLGNNTESEEQKQLEEQNPELNNDNKDNNDNNDNMRIMQGRDKTKNINDKILKASLASNNDDDLKKAIEEDRNNLEKTIEDYVNDNQSNTAKQDVDKVSSLEKDNRTLTNNMQIIKEIDTIKNSNGESSKTLLDKNKGNLEKTIEENKGNLEKTIEGNKSHLEKTIENYVNDNKGDPRNVAEAIRQLTMRDNANSLENYSRIFVFSNKDQRAQQVYETYKKVASQKNTIVNDDASSKWSMYQLSDVHYINTPCGSCF